MKSHSHLIDVVKKFPYPSCFKTPDTAKYIACNSVLAQLLGTVPEDMEGLTLGDLNFLQSPSGKEYADKITKLDFRARDEKDTVMDRHPFLTDSGDVRYLEMVKFPVLGAKKNVLGIVSYSDDLRPTLSYPTLYRLYRRFHGRQESIKRVLAYLKIDVHLQALPTEIQLLTFLEKADGHADEDIARRLLLSVQQVESHLVAVRDLVINRNLFTLLTPLTRDTKPCEEI
jgi:hypothetical protein